MVQISEDTIISMKNLNKNLDWKLIRNDWIIPMMKELNNIYDSKLNPDCCENDFKAEYMAKVKAFGRLEMIISKIDDYAGADEKKTLAEDFE